MTDPASPFANLATGLAPAATEPTASPVDTIDRQVFCIGALQLAARFDDATQLTEMPPVFRLPGAARELLGVTNLRGSVVPVFRLHEWLGESYDAKARHMLLVFGLGARAAGLVIDGLPTRRKFASGADADGSAADSSAASSAHAPWLVRTWRDDAPHLWHEFDFPRIFASLSGASVRDDTGTSIS